MLFVCRYIFLEYRNPRDAQEAVATANGYKLDKQHTFIVNLFSDFDKYVQMFGSMLLYSHVLFVDVVAVVILKLFGDI